MNLLRIIKEEIENFYSDWHGNDEPSIADKYYEKQLGLQQNSQQQKEKINAELIGYVDKQMTSPLNPPVPVYKNPKTLDGFSNNTRGILLNNGDLYLAVTYNAFHDNILEMLSENGIISYKSKFDYGRRYPNEFIAVVRDGGTKTFTQSTAYDKFPNDYHEIFDVANERQPYQFKEYEQPFDFGESKK
jgi:hypothetical protein